MIKSLIIIAYATKPTALHVFLQFTTLKDGGTNSLMVPTQKWRMVPMVVVPMVTVLRAVCRVKAMSRADATAVSTISRAIHSVKTVIKQMLDQHI